MKSLLLEPQVSVQGSPEMAPPDNAAPLPQFSVSVPPSWVFLTEIDTQDPDPEAPVSLLLVDEQVHVDNDARYFRSVRLLKTTAAVTTESQVSIDFDPKTDRLALHSVAICRGGDRREMAQLKHFRVIQRETNLERLSYHHFHPGFTHPDINMEPMV